MSEGHCDIHNVDMKELTNSNTGDKFWSHYTDDEKYPAVGKAGKRCCNGKPPKSEQSQKQQTESGDACIRLRIYELALSYAQDNMVPWIERAEKYIFEGKILTENLYPPEE